MYPSGSKTSSGFSLLEVLVAVGVSAILLIAVTRFYKDAYKTYNMQEQLSDRDRNAQYTIDKIAEFLEQAGSCLPDTGASGWDSVITTTPPSTTPATGVILGRNTSSPCVTDYFSSAVPTNLTKIPVGDTASYRKATHVLMDFAASAQATVSRKISTMNNGPTLDTVTVNSVLPVALDTGDLIYPYKRDTLSLSGGNFMVGTLVHAENIDSLKLYFYTAAKTATTSWKNMRSLDIRVTARTARPDPNLPAPGYRRITLSRSIVLRTRI